MKHTAHSASKFRAASWMTMLVVATLALPAVLPTATASTPIAPGVSATILDEYDYYGTAPLVADGDRFATFNYSRPGVDIWTRDALGEWTRGVDITLPCAPYSMGYGSIALRGSRLAATTGGSSSCDGLRVYDHIGGTWQLSNTIALGGYGSMGALAMTEDGRYLLAGDSSNSFVAHVVEIIGPGNAVVGPLIQVGDYGSGFRVRGASAHGDAFILPGNCVYSYVANAYVNAAAFTVTPSRTLAFKQGFPCSTSSDYASKIVIGGDRIAIGLPYASDTVLYGGSISVWNRDANGVYQHETDIASPVERQFAYFGNHQIAMSAEGVIVAPTTAISSTPSVPAQLHVYAPIDGTYERIDSVPVCTLYVAAPAITGAHMLANVCTLQAVSPSLGLHVFDFDADKDGLAKWTEIAFGTDPADADTDDDFWSDGAEYVCGSLGDDAMSFPTPACEGELPDQFTLAGGPAPGLAADALAAAHGPLAGNDADGDWVLDVAESRLCGTGATETAIAAAGGAAGSCASAADHEIADNPLRDPASLFGGATDDADTIVRGLDVSELQGVGPNGVSLWEAACMIEDANTPDDGVCTGSGATSQYTPPSP